MRSDLLASLRRLPDAELVARVKDLAARERGAMVLLVAHLAELDTRDVHLRAGHGSLFAYCRQVLALSEQEAYNRIAVARATRRFPMILERLEAGALNLTTVRLLAPHLTSENHREVLDSARGKSKLPVEEIAARLWPRPDVPSYVRKLPAPKPPAAPPGSAPPSLGASLAGSSPVGASPLGASPLGPSPLGASPLGPSPLGASPLGPSPLGPSPLGPSPLGPSPLGASPLGASPLGASPLGPSSEVGTPSAPAGISQRPPIDNGTPPQAAPALPSLPLPLARRSAEVTPLSPDRYRVQITIGGDTLEKLRLAKDLLRHAVPSGDEATILDRALTALLADLAQRKFAAAEKPRGSGGTAPGSRHIPAEVKRAVWLRDLGRCAFVGTNGQRCSERGFLEFHHVHPYGLGGGATAGNIQLRCRAHNDYEARVCYGRGNGHGEGGFVREEAATYWGVSTGGTPGRELDPEPVRKVTAASPTFCRDSVSPTMLFRGRPLRRAGWPRGRRALP